MGRLRVIAAYGLVAVGTAVAFGALIAGGVQVLVGFLAGMLAIAAGLMVEIGE